MKVKIKNDLINLGYEREIIDDILNNIKIDDTDIRNKEEEKIRKQLSKKYDGQELDYKVKQKLYSKGFKVSSYE